MKPSQADFDQLLQFEKVITQPDFSPIRSWKGGKPLPDGSTTTLYPEYDPIVSRFYEAASAEAWRDEQYNPEEAQRMIAEPSKIAGASLEEIRSLLTYCARGERFADGHWAAMIERGYIKQIFARLTSLRESSQ